MEGGNWTQHPKFSLSTNHSNINATASSFQPYNFLPRMVLETWLIVALTICVTGSAMIILLLALLGLNHQLRTGAAVLIFHLLFLGLLMSAIILPVNTVAFYTMQSNITVYIDCGALQFVQIATANVENWTAVFLAINRFVATLFPHHYKLMVTKNVLVSMILASWVIGFGNNVHLYLSGTFGRILFKGCGMRVEGVKAVIFTAIGNYIPLATIVSLYLIIMWKMFLVYAGQRFCQSRRGQDETSLQRTVKRRLAVARMLFVSALFHCCCFLCAPFVILFYPSLYQSNQMLQYWLRLLPICGYAANPLIFLVLSKDYQTALKNCCVGNRKTGQIPVVTKLELVDMRPAKTTQSGPVKDGAHLDDSGINHMTI